MCKIIISINPIYVENILNGSKRFEYRTKLSKESVDSLIIYETHPVKKIVGEVEVIGTLQGTPEELWDNTFKFSGIDKKSYDKYFYKRKTAYAYVLGDVIVYDKPLDLTHFGLKCPPQSFVYVR